MEKFINSINLNLEVFLGNIQLMTSKNVDNCVNCYLLNNERAIAASQTLKTFTYSVFRTLSEHRAIVNPPKSEPPLFNIQLVNQGPSGVTELNS